MIVAGAKYIIAFNTFNLFSINDIYCGNPWKAVHLCFQDTFGGLQSVQII